MTKPAIKLRPYQRQALEAVFDAIAGGITRPAVVMPTGAGKTIVMASLANARRLGVGNVLILVHRDELITQTIAKIKAVSPDVTVGIVQGQTDDRDHPIVVASVQTLSQPRRLRNMTKFNTIIVDECHHAVADTWQRVINSVGPGIPVIGFTATMARGDGKALGDVWAKIVYEIDILDMIRVGALSDVRGLQVTLDGLDLDSLSRSGKDFTDASLADVMGSDGARELIVNTIRKHAEDTPSIVFMPGVAEARELADDLNRADIPARAVWGSMPLDDRRAAISDYDAGRYQVIVNCMALTEGFDSPRASCAVIARPTTNSALYTQMVGRVLRPFPGKTSAMVLDISGASSRCELATISDLSSREIGPIEPGETLGLAAARTRLARGLRLADYVADSREIELFKTGKTRWLQTRGGIRFTSLPGDVVIFLWPERDGSYAVGLRPVKQPGGRWLARGLDFGTAFQVAQQGVTEYVALVQDQPEDAGLRAWSTARSASWRYKSATQGQADMAKRLGVTFDGWVKEPNRGQVSDEIAVALASRVLDRSSR